MDYVKRLEKLMSRLRSPGGCPWDRRQTHQSLKPYLLEEAHETLDAIDRRNPAHLREELGDLLLQVVFHSQLARERGRFNFQDVARTIGDKLVRRHPHVFGKGASRRVADINRRWEELKRQEKPERKSVLDGLPRSLPALLRAQRMHEKIGKKGTDRDTRRAEGETRRAMQRFLASLKEGKGAKRDRAEKAGEFLLAFARLSQSAGVHAEMALSRAAARFEKAYRASERRKAPTTKDTKGTKLTKTLD